MSRNAHGLSILRGACVLSILAGTRGAIAQSITVMPLVPTSAPDLRGAAMALALSGAALSLLPADVGFDAVVGARGSGTVRATVAWPMQIPLPLRDASGTVTYTHHRIVLSPAMALGPQRIQLEDGSVARAAITFHARIGYRYVHHVRSGAFGALVGLGGVSEFWPVLRAGAGVEVGLHIGACCGDPALIVTFVMRADFFFALDDRMRLGAALGWAFY